MTREEAKIWLNKLYTRTDITDEYGDMEDMQPYAEAVDMATKALEQEPNWILVSDRLPDEDGRYIVFMDTIVFSIRILHFARNLNEISLDFNCYSNIKKAGWYDYDSENGYFEWTGIEAWMPLPEEPYKIESEDRK